MRLRQSLSSESGFSLVEVGIAILLFVVLAAAMGSSLSTATDTIAESRSHDQAMALLAEEMEAARSLPWEEVAMFSVDGSAPLLNDSASRIVGSEAGLLVDESLITSTSGRIMPIGAQERDGISYTVHRYVTDADTNLVRVIVLVEWTMGGETRSLQSSTLISALTAGSGDTTTTTAPDDGSGDTTTTTAPDEASCNEDEADHDGDEADHDGDEADHDDDEADHDDDEADHDDDDGDHDDDDGDHDDDEADHDDDEGCDDGHQDDDGDHS